MKPTITIQEESDTSRNGLVAWINFCAVAVHCCLADGEFNINTLGIHSDLYKQQAQEQAQAYCKYIKQSICIHSINLTLQAVYAVLNHYTGVLK